MFLQKQTFRIINSGSDVVMKVKWLRMEGVSAGALARAAELAFAPPVFSLP